MTKKKLIELLAQAENLSHKQSKQIIDSVFHSIADTLVRMDRVEIRGFGSFMARQYDGYTGKNPKTGEVVQVKPKKLPFFKVGKSLKERIDYK